MEDGKRKREDDQSNSVEREELLARLTELENRNRDLEEQLSRVQQNQSSISSQSINKKQKNEKEPKLKKRKVFDFSRYNVRYVALKIAYLGWDYHGFASQENNENTIEGHLFNALQKACLIKDRSTCNYSRCGRTDKGVSAFAQVISLEIRSNLDEGDGVIQKKESNTQQDNSTNKNSFKEEINYVYVLNKLLPDEIRVLAWIPVALDFKARFSCVYRMYKYYFPAGDFDIELMNKAGKRFIGEHDFRNFCKMDVANNVTSFRRNILSVDVQRMNNCSQSEYDMCVVTVKGMAFLWHQIRCMVAILFLVGQNLEKPEIIDHMLDITKCPRRPQYSMASEIPLVLFHCEYNDINWQYAKDEVTRIRDSYQKLWTTSSIKTTMMRELLNGEHTDTTEDNFSCKKGDKVAGMCLIPGHYVKSYKKILDRALCDSLETKLENLSAKQERLKKKISME
ncbi:tRNA pseudouridine(38/39) synthase-like [Dendronephthya gigantea]|uniref:tRNA pseudouridine(38/39) synthase-like n=1 Tax=Dendronephthya gigantea TaxID=151771 RepID=UPI001068DAAE|nr:tRNA pseudouridine(38/39) synthase-like [Dendronephthya gigantea]